MSNYNIQSESINGFEYGWSSVSFEYCGAIIKGITSINYTENLDTQPVYGKGAKPIGYSTGNFTYSGSMTIHKSELDKIRFTLATVAKDTLLDAEPANIVVTYRNVSGSTDQVTVDTLKGVMLQSNDLTTNQGDMVIECTVNFAFCDIESSTI